MERSEVIRQTQDGDPQAQGELRKNGRLTELPEEEYTLLDELPDWNETLIPWTARRNGSASSPSLTLCPRSSGSACCCSITRS